MVDALNNDKIDDTKVVVGVLFASGARLSFSEQCNLVKKSSLAASRRVNI